MDRIGRDSARREGGRLIVESSAAMPEWRPARYRPTAVVYEGERFLVSAVEPAGGGRHRYVLEPWPDALWDRPSRTIVYDEDYARARDAGRARAFTALLLRPLLWCANPLLGCLWIPTKCRLRARLGLDPRLATLQALACQYAAVLLLVLATWAALFGVALLPFGWPAILGAAGLLLLDAILRYDHLQKHPHDFLGVGEWLARIRR